KMLQVYDRPNMLLAKGTDSISPLEPKDRRFGWKALEAPLAERNKARCILAGQVADKPGDQDAARLGFAAQAEGHLNRQAEKVIVLGDRFAGVDADPHPQAFGGFNVVEVESLLDVGGGADRVRDLVERGHHAVAGVFHFAAGVRCEPAPD